MRHAFALFALCALSAAGPAHAHASEQGFVLLLPTEVYIAGGVASVLLTVVLIAILPAGAARAIFRPVALFPLPAGLRRATAATSLMALAGLLAVLWLGATGPHDPTRNALPLTIWTLFWVAVVAAQGLFGNLWAWLNPWTGAHALWPWRPLARLPRAVGHWPALAGFLAFAGLLLIHPAPTDPDVLVRVVSGYCALTFAGMALFGRRWLLRAEALTVLLRAYAQVAAFGRRGPRLALGLPGWRVVGRAAPPATLALFMLATLAVGSFDGLNETFWWFGRIGINPLEFPGRSAVIGPNAAGLALALPLLAAAYAVSVWLGWRMIGAAGAGRAMRALAPAILPIALGYHIGHYLPGFLVEFQHVARYAAAALGLPPVTVTTGFFNTLATVRVIWLAQAGSVVVGHALAILLSHRIALGLTGSHRRAAISQAPLAAFMIAYTLFGLWLLASPRGV